MPKPVQVSPNFSSISRSKGKNAASQISYITGQSLRDRTGEWYNNPRSDVVGVQIYGWGEAGPLDGDARHRAALQDIVNQVQAIDWRKNAREGQRIIIPLPTHDSEARYSLALSEQMDGNHRWVADDLGFWMHKRVDALVIGSIHRAPHPETSPYQGHAHFFVSRREVKDGRLGATDVEAFSSPGRVSDFIGELRREMEHRFNRHMRHSSKREADRKRRFTTLSYAEQATRENVERAAKGLQPIKELKPMSHEGPSGSAMRRQLAQGKEPRPWKDPTAQASVRAKLRENDMIRAENVRIEKTNDLIRSHDPMVIRIKEYAAELDAADAARRPAEGTPWKLQGMVRDLPSEVRGWMKETLSSMGNLAKEIAQTIDPAPSQAKSKAKEKDRGGFDL